MAFVPLLLSVIVGFAATTPQVLPLNKYLAGSSTIVNGVEAGCKLYVASRDDRSSLQKISVKTGTTWTSLDTLSDYYDDGTPKYLNITGGLEIKTTNIDAITDRLRGYIYITTYQQAHDPTFAVYVITGNHTISRDGMKTTSVVLNTHLDTDLTNADVPEKTSYVTNIQHSSNTNLYFMWGVPAANWYDVNNNIFFKNPLTLSDSSKVFFDHVEPLQVDLDYWYFMSMGPVRMDVENKLLIGDTYTTTSVNTTGITVTNFLYENHRVNFLLDKARRRTTGTMISTQLDTNVTFQFVGDESVAKIYGANVYQTLDEYHFQADRLLVNSTILPGNFYCQYFGFSTDLLPATTNAPSSVPPTTNGQTSRPVATTPSVATTTKSSSSVFRFGLDLLILTLSSVFVY